ncbi:IclR family transcriptional regulator [Mycolicibacter heraklionensis]|uniref:IclR family transcriptional regulator n=1 Tax=Mycolicibacter heraklionensis TaxID=512402 RepID=A0ABR5FK51_9MYCO|nr:IclR family transcriptional regulator [Mycolicibacter heraklionensis]KLO31377.1 IclR family transcriptional regulator [Mycolicibacter heraklionensis]
MADKLRTGSAKTDDDPSARQGIQSVELAMTVLQALEDGRSPMSLTQLATASGMTPSKVHRYLVSLSRVGLVARSPSTGLYDMGPALRRLGIESLRRMDEVALISEHLPGLRDRTSHAVNLAVWSDHGPVIVRWDYGSYALPITVRVGATLPLLTSSVGRVFLTYLPSALTKPVVRRESAAGSRPPTADEIAEITAEVARSGLSITSGGIIPGIASVAAPVFAAGESLPLVVAVVLPAQAATRTTVDAVSKQLLSLTATMSNELGSAQTDRGAN